MNKEDIQQVTSVISRNEVSRNTLWYNASTDFSGFLYTHKLSSREYRHVMQNKA
jgi:hypothetical protein